jgi:hypothetical protein
METQAITHTPITLSYQVFLHYAAPSAGDGVVEVKDPAGACFQVVAQQPAANGWFTATLAGLPQPVPQSMSGDLVWNNIGEAVVDKVMLVAPDVLCVPYSTEYCQLTDQRAQTLISSQFIGEEGDALRVLQLHSFADRRPFSVITYIDHREAYRRHHITPVDLRYMRAGTHEVETHIFYTDGTQVISSELVTNSSEDLSTYYYVYIAPHMRTIGFAAMIIVAVTSWWGMVFTVHALYRRHLWVKEHHLDDY